MAKAPTVPNFAQYNFVLGDTHEAIEKQNGQNAALVQFGSGLQAMCDEIVQEQEGALSAAEQLRQQTVSDTTLIKNQTVAARNAAQTAESGSQEARAGAEAARDAAQKIATGEVAITSLQPGTGQEGDLVSPDGEGGLEYTRTLKRYGLKPVATTATLDLAAGNVFTVDTTAARTLTLANAPGADEAMVVVLNCEGGVTPAFPAAWAGTWVEGFEPTLSASWTQIVQLWDGVRWTGNVRARQ